MHHVSTAKRRGPTLQAEAEDGPPDKCQGARA